ncbi:TonB-dependent receptor [Acidihalobacter prosperus]|uniref:TonB-dependent receptor n=1 Tax=Acidihalobacter prosperus TaxID=160660 RepID=A0A1A6C474_9GAMM|nr:TonB-dependent receptor [Acidihalobacter prosperus]OBS09363.1 TonB-dependent receptor [Acidihalobacter prosperus]
MRFRNFRRNQLALSILAAMPVVAMAAPAQSTTQPKEAASASDTAKSASSPVYNVGVVSDRLSPLDTLGKLPSMKHIFDSTQSVKVIGKQELDTVGPGMGAGQALEQAPGVNVLNDGPSGAPRASISINGMKTGWGNIGGNANDGMVMVTFDGVPMIDPAYGVWQASEVPQISMFKGISVTYGPGYPVNRWYDNIGGSVNFMPLQPSAKPGVTIGGFVGSFDTQGANFSAQSGSIDGWSTVVAGGVGSSGNFVNGYGFNNPANNYAYYAKTTKTFNGGHLSFGAYTSHSVAYRPVPIPVSPNSNVTIYGVDPNTGNPIPGPVYSQSTTGYYTSLPKSTYWKRAFVNTTLIYSKFEDALTQDTHLHNMLFYRYGNRIHLHYNNLGQSPSVLYQYYNATSHTYGDKLYLSFALPYHNLVSVGGYFVNNQYYSLLDFYNPTQTVNVNGQTLYHSLSLPHHFHSSYLYETDLAAFVQDDFQPTDRFRITPGIRVVNFKSNFVNNAAAAFPINVQYAIGNNGDTQPNSETSFTEVEPSIGANWKITKKLALYANYATGYRSPAGATGTYAHFLVSTLKPQKSTQYQIGVKAYLPHDGYLRNALLSVNYYHLDDTNEIIPIPVVSHAYSLFASGSSTFDGVNLSFVDNPVYSLHLFANLSIERAVYSNYVSPSHGSYNGKPISNVPDHTVNAGVFDEFYREGVIYKPRLWWNYTGAQYIYNNNTGAPTTQKLPAFGLWNAGLKIVLGRQVGFAGMKSLSLRFDVTNLLGKKYNAYEYISGGGYYGIAGQLLAEPGAPRAYYASVEAHF